MCSSQARRLYETGGHRDSACARSHCHQRGGVTAAIACAFRVYNRTGALFPVRQRDLRVPVQGGRTRTRDRRRTAVGHLAEIGCPPDRGAGSDGDEHCRRPGERRLVDPGANPGFDRDERRGLAERIRQLGELQGACCGEGSPPPSDRADCTVGGAADRRP
jgi:hypothetical protein